MLTAPGQPSRNWSRRDAEVLRSLDNTHPCRAPGMSWPTPGARGVPGRSARFGSRDGVRGLGGGFGVGQVEHLERAGVGALDGVGAARVRAGLRDVGDVRGEVGPGLGGGSLRQINLTFRHYCQCQFATTRQ